MVCVVWIVMGVTVLAMYVCQAAPLSRPSAGVGGAVSPGAAVSRLAVKGGKKMRTGPRPKKPLSAYMIFASEKRDGVQRENPGA